MVKRYQDIVRRHEIRENIADNPNIDPLVLGLKNHGNMTHEYRGVRDGLHRHVLWPHSETMHHEVYYDLRHHYGDARPFSSVVEKDGTVESQYDYGRARGVVKISHHPLRGLEKIEVEHD